MRRMQLSSLKRSNEGEAIGHYSPQVRTLPGGYKCILRRVTVYTTLRRRLDR